MTDYRGKPLVVRRDRTVVYGGTEIGRVYPDPADDRINHDWCYEHASGVTEDDARPSPRRRCQGAFTKRQAAEALARLHELAVSKGKIPVIKDHQGS
jgi:hypothetical protein